MDVLGKYQVLLGFLCLGAVFGGIALVAPMLLSPRTIGQHTEETYECGMDTVGSAWIRFSIAFYLFALIFVAFEVDILYLFPVALVYNSFEWRDLIEVSMFLLILSLAIIFAWRRGVFRWD